MKTPAPSLRRPQLRIYCICGQKMKVTETMFGRPGKCIACRQKIRIPRLDEVPEDGSPIYLKDHPEFLRKPSRRTRTAEDLGEVVEEVEDVVLGDPDDPTSEVVPLEVLPPLQRLWSYEQKLGRQLAPLREAEQGRSEQSEKNTLLGYRGLVRTARQHLEDQLRRQLGETVDALGTVRDKLTRLNMALRMGEMDFGRYQAEAGPLRRERDRLLRWQHNLRGWLGVSDAAMAGGYVEVRYEDIPVEAQELESPLEAPGDAALLDVLLMDLREALRIREQRERECSEWERMGKEGAVSGATLQDGKLESEAALLRAKAGVAFARTRLESYNQELDSDSKAIKAQLEKLRAQLGKGELSAAAFQARELELLRAQADIGRAREIVVAALKATTAAQVPALRETLVKRLAGPQRERILGLDSWLAWIAAALLLVNLVVPVARLPQGVGNLAALPEFSLALFAAAVALTLSAPLPSRVFRGFLFCGMAAALGLGGTFILQQAWFGMSAAGTAMRSNPQWFLAPGVLLFGVAVTVTGLAGGVALSAAREYRFVPFLTALLTVAGIAAISTDGFGLLRAQPVLAQPQITQLADLPGEYSVEIRIGNRGLRTAWIEGRASDAPLPIVFLLERRVGEDSWTDANQPESVRVAGGPWEKSGWSGFRSVALAGGGELSLRYRLGPGTYRATLNRAGASAASRQEVLFALEAPAQAGATAEMPASGAVSPTLPATSSATEATEPEETEPAYEETASAAASGMVSISLSGVGNSEGRNPRFICTIQTPQGSSEQRRVSLGDTVYGSWTAAEFRPSAQALTLSNGSQLLVLRSGEPVRVPVE